MKKNKLILVIDDDTENNLLMRRIIGFIKEEPFFVVSGEYALNWLQNNRPDLILCDISLPDISGLELIRQIRLMEGFQSLPVIAVSAHDLEEDINDALNAGFTDYQVKPFMPHELINRIKKYLYE